MGAEPIGRRKMITKSNIPFMIRPVKSSMFYIIAEDIHGPISICSFFAKDVGHARLPSLRGTLRIAVAPILVAQNAFVSRISVFTSVGIVSTGMLSRRVTG